MKMNELFLQLKDIQFQADKLMKMDLIDGPSVVNFAAYSGRLKYQLSELNFGDGIDSQVEKLEVLNPNYIPPLSVRSKLTVLLTLGLLKKRIKRTKTQAYFRESIREARDCFTYVDLRLKEL